MWDGAAEIARMMREGEYYLIKNARMRANRGGFLEGKVAQSKIFLLEEQDAKTNVHLQALLECVDQFTPSFIHDSRLFIGGRRFGQPNKWPNQTQKWNTY
jgi:hypothetical protein